MLHGLISIQVCYRGTTDHLATEKQGSCEPRGESKQYGFHTFYRGRPEYVRGQCRGGV